MRDVAHYQAQKDVARVRGTILMVLWIGFALSLMLAGLIFFGAGFSRRASSACLPWRP